MTNTRTYHFPTFRMEYTLASGEVRTICNDGKQCLVKPNSEDEKHAAALSISPGSHKRLHEISHSLLAFAMGAEICPIIRAQCLLQPMPDNAKELEEMIMSLSYAALKKPMLNLSWWNELGKVQQYCNPFNLAENIYRLWSGEEIKGVTIKTI